MKYLQEETYKSAYRAFFGVCIRYCRTAEDANEVFNDAMLSFFAYESKNKITEESKYAFIKKIIINKCIDHLRKSKLPFDAFEDSMALSSSTPSDAEFNLISEELLRTIQNFPTQTKLVFNLYIFEGWSHQEIASHLGISTNTTNWHINQGKKQILSLLEKPNLA